MHRAPALYEVKTPSRCNLFASCVNRFILVLHSQVNGLCNNTNESEHDAISSLHAAGGVIIQI